MQYLVGLLVVGFVIVSVMMMLVVLIQRPTGGGLSGAFGSASEGAGQTAFGARTGDALTTATIIIFLLFLGFAIGLNYMVQAPSATAPAATSAPTAPAQSGPGDASFDPTAPVEAEPDAIEDMPGPSAGEDDADAGIGEVPPPAELPVGDPDAPAGAGADGTGGGG